jgi:hypothetical protein
MPENNVVNPYMVPERIIEDPPEGTVLFNVDVC